MIVKPWIFFICLKNVLKTFIRLKIKEIITITINYLVISIVNTWFKQSIINALQIWHNDQKVAYNRYNYYTLKFVHCTKSIIIFKFNLKKNSKTIIV